MVGAAGGPAGRSGGGSGGPGGAAGGPVHGAGGGGRDGRPTSAVGDRSRRGVGGWTSCQIPVEEVDCFCRRYPTVLVLSEERIKAARLEWEQVTVVVRSLGRRVPTDWIAKDVAARGGIGYELEFFILANDHLALRFKSPEDRDKVLADGPWVVAGQLIAMEAWKPNFIPGPGAISSAAVWIRLPKLPMEYWGSDSLMEIASVAGQALAVEEVTGQRRRMGFARVKVVIDTSKPLIPGVLLKGEGEDMWQAFVYESLPEYCYGCGRIGHGQVKCPFLRPESSSEAGERGERACSSASVAAGGADGQGCPELLVRR